MEDNFWKTVRIWSQKPHVVNKRLAGVVTLFSWKFPSKFTSWVDMVEKTCEINGQSEEKIKEAIEGWNWEAGNLWTDDFPHHDSSLCYVSLRKCLPKQPHRFQPVYEVEFIGVY